MTQTIENFGYLTIGQLKELTDQYEGNNLQKEIEQEIDWYLQ